MNTRHGETGFNKIMMFKKKFQYLMQKELHYIKSSNKFQYKTIRDGHFITRVKL